MRRVSIRTLMVLIVLVAVGMAALKNADELWDATILLVASVAVGFAILAAVLLRGQEQAWWIGFVLFGGSYLHVTVGPWAVEAFRQRLATTYWIGDLRNRMSGTTVQALLDEKGEIRAQLARLEPGSTKYDPAAATLRNSLREIDNELVKNRLAARRFDYFQSIAHSLVAIIAGLAGGMIAVWLWGRRNRAEVAAPAANPVG